MSTELSYFLSSSIHNSGAMYEGVPILSSMLSCLG